LGDDLISPLSISIADPIHDIIMPSSSIVVSQAVREATGPIPNTALAPVEFSKIVNFKYSAGDFSYYQSKYFLQDPAGRRSDLLLGLLPDDPTLHSTASHLELVLPNMYRLKQQFADACEATVKLNHLTIPLVRFVFAPSAMAEYPAFWSRVCFFQRALFDRLEKFIDWDYFTSAEVDL
jgi:hypothetical protein